MGYRTLQKFAGSPAARSTGAVSTWASTARPKSREAYAKVVASAMAGLPVDVGTAKSDAPAKPSLTVRQLGAKFGAKFVAYARAC